MKRHERYGAQDGGGDPAHPELPPHPRHNNRALLQQQRSAQRGVDGKRGLPSTSQQQQQQQQQKEEDQQQQANLSSSSANTTSQDGNTGSTTAEGTAHVVTRVAHDQGAYSSSSSTSSAPYNQQGPSTAGSPSEAPPPPAASSVPFSRHYHHHHNPPIARRRAVGSRGLPRTRDGPPSVHPPPQQPPAHNYPAMQGGSYAPAASATFAAYRQQQQQQQQQQQHYYQQQHYEAERLVDAYPSAPLLYSAHRPPSMPLPPADPDLVESSASSSDQGDSESDLRKRRRRKRDGSWWSIFTGSKSEAQPLYLILVVGLAGLPHLHEKEQVMKVIVATATYGMAVVFSFFILQVIARCGLWTPPRSKGRREVHVPHHAHKQPLPSARAREMERYASHEPAYQNPQQSPQEQPGGGERGGSEVARREDTMVVARWQHQPPHHHHTGASAEEQTSEGKTTGPSEKEEGEEDEVRAAQLQASGARERMQERGPDSTDGEDEDWAGGDTTTGIEDSGVDEEGSFTTEGEMGALKEEDDEDEEEEDSEEEQQARTAPRPASTQASAIVSRAPAVTSTAMVATGPPPPQLRLASPPRPMAVDGDEQRMLGELRAALQTAQLEATTLKLKVNYYDMELSRQKRERSAELDRVMSRQKTDMSKLFGMMLRHSPRPMRDALEPKSTDVLAVISARPPFEILHVNREWSRTFHWDDYEVLGGVTNLDFFRGLVLDGSTWEDLLETLSLYGYASADILNRSSDGGYFFHSMTVTPLVDVSGVATPLLLEASSDKASEASHSDPSTPRASTSTQGGDGSPQPPQPQEGEQDQDGSSLALKPPPPSPPPPPRMAPADVGSVKVQGHLIRSSVRTVPTLPEDLRRRLEMSAAATYGMGGEVSNIPPVPEGDEGAEEGETRPPAPTVVPSVSNGALNHATPRSLPLPLPTHGEQEAPREEEEEQGSQGPSAIEDGFLAEVGERWQHQPLALLLDAMNKSAEPLALVDLRGEIMHLNPAFHRATSLCLRDVEGLSLEDVMGYGGEGRQGWEERLRIRVKDGVSRERVQVGEDRWVVAMSSLRPRERALVAVMGEE